MAETKSTQVAVIGGVPAGLAVSTLLARKGIRVRRDILLAKSRRKAK